MPGRTLRGSDQGGANPAFPLPNQPGKSARLSGRVLHPQRSPLSQTGPGDIGGRPGRSGEAGGRGPPKQEEQERSGGQLPHPLRLGEPAEVPGQSPTLQSHLRDTLVLGA